MKRKNHKLHNFVLGMVIMALLVSLAAPAFAVTGRKQMVVDNTDIHLHVDGIPVSASPFASGGTTYLPVRAVGEALGMDVRWDGPTHTVYISDPTEPSTTNSNTSSTTVTGKQTIDVDYLDIKLVVNGKEVTPKDVNGNVVEPFAYQGTTYLPVRAVGEALGKTVRWDGETKTVHLGELPQATYLVDVCKQAYGLDFVYRASDHESFTTSDGKRYSQGFKLDYNIVFDLGGKYEKLTFDCYAKYEKTLSIYLDGKLAQEIELVEGIQTVTVPLNYAGTIGFGYFGEGWIANAILSGERTVTKPVPPANATYLADACTISGGARGSFTDTFENEYTNAVKLDKTATIDLNGKYKTLTATIFQENESGWSTTETRKNALKYIFENNITHKFYVDGNLVAEIDLWDATSPQTIEIPLNYGMELKIERSSRSYYLFLADAILE